jgi:chromatin remodeling complex protein RSC6
MADNKLRKVFGKDEVATIEMNQHLVRHLKRESAQAQPD